MHGLQNRVAIVTGGGGGIGNAICCRLSQGGAKVAVVDMNASAAAATVDITDVAAITAGIAATEADLGPVDILVNNAGWDVFKPFLKTEPALWQKIIDINLTGALNMHYSALPGMVARDHGRIINVASDAARVGSSGEAVYAACKAGLVGLSKTLARAHARHGITFTEKCKPDFRKYAV